MEQPDAIDSATGLGRRGWCGIVGEDLGTTDELDRDWEVKVSAGYADGARESQLRWCERVGQL